jgi:cobaltochelatase CobT
MAGYEQFLCAQLGYVLAETCSLIRVPFESLGFTTGFHYGSRSRYGRSYRGDGDATEVSGVYYHRTNPLKLIVIKPFEMTKRSDVLTKFYAAASWTGGGTTEGEAILWAAKRLAKQRRQRRLLITICDGAPNGNPAPTWKFEEHVSTTIDRLQRAGIETMHVGIGTDAPKRYVPEHTFVRYDGIDSLITEFAPSFGAILLNERRRNTPPVPMY